MRPDMKQLYGTYFISRRLIYFCFRRRTSRVRKVQTFCYFSYCSRLLLCDQPSPVGTILSVAIVSS